MKIWLWILYCMHSYCTKLFHCKILLCLRKERLHIPTLFVDLLSTPTIVLSTFLKFVLIFEIKLLIFYCSEYHFKNKLVLSLPKCLLQLLLKLHCKTYTQISHSQRFIGIGYVKLATKNRVSPWKNDTNNRVADLLLTLSQWKFDCEYFIVCRVAVRNYSIAKYYYV
jgi:hypothetical protein